MANNYNATVLDAELRAAGLPIVGCTSEGVIEWASTPTSEQLSTSRTVMAAHDPSRLPARQAKLESLRAKRRAGTTLSTQDIQDALDVLLEV